MGYEDNFIRGIDRHRAEERAERKENIGNSIETIIPNEYEAAVNYNKKSAIRMGSFRDLYGPETVQRDIDEVNRLKRVFNRSGQDEFYNGLSFEDVRQLSEISESFLLRGINESNWIPFCTAIKTSDYDDYKNGLDLVLEYQKDDNPASHIGLGVDITFAASIDKKLKRIKDDIEKGELSSIKYFDSPKSHIRGELRVVPRGVVGFDIDTLNRLAKQRTSNGMLSKDDPTRLITLHQLDMQLRTYTEYAQEIGSPVLPTLIRSSKFVELLAKFVYQHTSHHHSIIKESESVTKLARRLEVFKDL